VTIEHRLKGSRTWKRLKTLDTTAVGVYALKTKHRSGQRYRVKWTAPDGRTYTGPPVRAYS
jgi:hypothetical protein